MSFLIFLAAASQSTIINDQAIAMLKKGDPPFVYIKWQESPNSAKIDSIAPKASGKWRYAHLECKTLLKNGHLSKCVPYQVERVDNEANKAALKLARYFVANQELIDSRSNVDFISLDIQFQYRGVSDIGQCAPSFCVGTPPPPTPPE